jgi:hypothetical protein
MAAPTTTQEMTLRNTNVPKGGFTYSDVFELAVETSDAILIPAGQIQDILYSAVGGTVTIFGTISTVEDIEANTAQWVAISPGIPINPAITAIYFNNAASTTVITLKVMAIGG